MFPHQPLSLTEEDMTRRIAILISPSLPTDVSLNRAVFSYSVVLRHRIAQAPQRLLLTLLAMFFLLFTAPLLAQDISPEFTTSSVANYGLDSVDLQTLVPSITVPIRTVKSGALPFSASVAVQSMCYAAIPSPGDPNYWYCNPFSSLTYAGYIPLAANTSGEVTGSPEGTTTCSQSGNKLIHNIGHWYISDIAGLSQHPLNQNLTLYDSYCPGTLTATTVDGSGLTTTISQSWGGALMNYTATITDKMGNTASLVPSPSGFA